MKKLLALVFVVVAGMIVGCQPAESRPGDGKVIEAGDMKGAKPAEPAKEEPAKEEPAKEEPAKEEPKA
ncbi:MAG: hypothetical protein ACKOU6_01745, partial [Planctomycetota bacterium]